MHVFLFVPYFLILWYFCSVWSSICLVSFILVSLVSYGLGKGMIRMYGGRGDTTISDYTTEHDNLPRYNLFVSLLFVESD